ncbi:hypothetical protein CI088_00090 [Enterococcus plantarum]|uniref:Uncharacterized protein n=1 Tax=Enterococcus plantarum TaxID=1077675 RepID=A0A2W3ZF93_9ENTE|nr:hypothetical protein [Enterococcus plantarum]PZL78206.1 hypothetical protein CI088_00090 [Enterococcus plantarum]
MKFYIKALMFFGLLAMIAYIGNQNLANALWLLFGVFIGFSLFYGMIRNGFLEIKSIERR